MKKTLAILISLFAAVSLISCESSTQKTDGGGIILSITDFGEAPLSPSVNFAASPFDPQNEFLTGGYIALSNVVIAAVVKEPNAPTANLQNVELQAIEVTYTRGDQGTRVPPPIVQNIFGVITPGGTNTLNRVDIITPEQLSEPPVEDLLWENGGLDLETRDESIVLVAHIRAFGRGLSGEELVSAPAKYSFRLVP